MGRGLGAPPITFVSGVHIPISKVKVNNKLTTKLITGPKRNAYAFGLAAGDLETTCAVSGGTVSWRATCIVCMPSIPCPAYLRSCETETCSKCSVKTRPPTRFTWVQECIALMDLSRFVPVSCGTGDRPYSLGYCHCRSGRKNTDHNSQFRGLACKLWQRRPSGKTAPNRGSAMDFFGNFYPSFAENKPNGGRTLDL